MGKETLLQTAQRLVDQFALNATALPKKQCHTHSPMGTLDLVPLKQFLDTLCPLYPLHKPHRQSHTGMHVKAIAWKIEKHFVRRYRGLYSGHLQREPQTEKSQQPFSPPIVPSLPF